MMAPTDERIMLMPTPVPALEVAATAAHLTPTIVRNAMSSGTCPCDLGYFGPCDADAADCETDAGVLVAWARFAVAVEPVRPFLARVIVAWEARA